MVVNKQLVTLVCLQAARRMLDNVVIKSLSLTNSREIKTMNVSHSSEDCSEIFFAFQAARIFGFVQLVF